MHAAVAVDVVVDLQKTPVAPVEDAARERAEDLDAHGREDQDVSARK